MMDLIKDFLANVEFFFVFYLIGYKAAYDRMAKAVPSTVEVSVAWQGVSPCGS